MADNSNMLEPTSPVPQPADATPPKGSIRDRRGGPDRRQSVLDRRSGLDRRKAAGHRRTDERRSAEEGEMSEEQFVFVAAINEYKKLNNCPFPTWTEVLDVIKYLGYRKVADVGEYRLTPRPSDEDGGSPD